MKKTNKRSIKNKLGVATVFGSLLAGSFAYADGFTDISGDPDFYYYTRLVYEDQIAIDNDTGSGDLPREITEIRLSDVSLLPGQSIQSIRLTLRTDLTGGAVGLDNDDPDSIGTAVARSFITQVESLTSNVGRQDLSNETIMVNAGVEETQNFSLAPSESFPGPGADDPTIFNADDGTADQDDWVQAGVFNEESGFILNVDGVSALEQYNDYIDNPDGWINFELIANFGTTAQFTGVDAGLGRFDGNTPNATFFAQVEYIIIPEPGTLAMAAIALGSVGGITLLRRRKRS